MNKALEQKLVERWPAESGAILWVVQSLSGTDWAFSQSNRSKAPSNSQ
jgi:hypothetical protein